VASVLQGVLATILRISVPSHLHCIHCRATLLYFIILVSGLGYKLRSSTLRNFLHPCVCYFIHTALFVSRYAVYIHYVAPCSLQIDTNVSEVYTVSLFRLQLCRMRNRCCYICKRYKRSDHSDIYLYLKMEEKCFFKTLVSTYKIAKMSQPMRLKSDEAYLWKPPNCSLLAESMPIN
jgi:hypothetical protein